MDISRRSALGLATAILIVTGCGADEAAPQADADSQLTISDFAFSAVSAPPGGEVEVTNTDDVAHTVTADGGEFDVRVDGGQAATFTAPEEAGEYDFICTLHPSMTGTLTVE